MTVDDVLPLVLRRVGEVMALPDTDVSPALRFEEDLHADSLDIVEIIEKVEADLREQGIGLSIPDTALITVRTVRDAADRIAEHARG
jgi:acyl carrier protein